MNTENEKKGFARLSLEERKRIASLGGKAAHLMGRAHEFTSSEAAAAGRKVKRSRQKAAVVPG